MGFSGQNDWNNHRNIQKAEKISKNRVKKKWTFFGRTKNVFVGVPQLRTASLGFPGAKKNEKMNFIQRKSISLRICFTMKKSIFYERKAGNLGISSETAVAGILIETTIPGISSETIRESVMRPVQPLWSPCEAPLEHLSGQLVNRLSRWSDRPLDKFPGRLWPRDYQAVSLAITRPTGCDFRKFRKIDFPDFFVKKSGKIRKICFLDSWDQNKILNFLDFFKIFIYDRYFLYKPLFPSSQPSKTLKIESAISKSTWGTNYSSFRPKKRLNRPNISQKSTCFDLCFLYEPILGPLKARFDQLDR